MRVMMMMVDYISEMGIAMDMVIIFLIIITIIITIIIIIIITRPRPAFGRLGLGGSSRGYSSQG